MWRPLKWLQYKLSWPDQEAEKNAPLDDQIGADVPIKSSADDLLRRTHFAERISEILSGSQVSEGRVFAIRGAWGQGKSSLKNLIIERLGKQSPPATWLEFNPWQWGDSDAIARALFAQMAGKLGGAHSPGAHKRAKVFRRYGERLLGVSRALKTSAGESSGVTQWIAVAALLAGSAGIAAPTIRSSAIISYLLIAAGVIVIVGKFLTIFGTDHTNDPVDVIRQDLEARLSKLAHPLVVFVDDIDRLEEDQIRMVFRHVKVNANLPNIIFVMLYQTSIVENALKPVAGDEGRAYLEKIVQANFDLPTTPPDRIFRIFTEGLSRSVGELATLENGFSETRWGNVLIGGLQPFIHNLRDVRRLLSSIAIHLPLHQGHRVFEVNLIDFIALETLRVFESQFHTAIAANKTLVLQLSRFSGDRRQEADKTAIADLVSLASPQSREACKNMLMELFPQIGWALGGTNYSADSWGESWRTDKRVCSHRVFDKYFELQIPEGTISESLFLSFVETAGESVALTAAMADLDTAHLLPALAARLDESVQSLPLEHIDNLLPAIFDLGEKVSDRSVDPFNPSFVNAWRAAVWYLRRIEGENKRMAIFLNAMQRSDALGVPAMLISLDMPREGDKERSIDLLFTPDDLEKAKRAWIEKFSVLAAQPEILAASNDLVSYLYRWGDFSGGLDAPKAWVAGIAMDDQLFPTLLSNFRTIGRTQSAGDRVSRRMESYQRTMIEELFGIDWLTDRLRRFDRSHLLADQLKAFELMDWHLARWRDGKSTD